MTPIKDLMLTFNLSTSLAKLLLILFEKRIVTGKEIVHEHKIATDAKVVIHRLRKCLEGYDIEIKSRREVGYWLDPSTKEKIKKLADNGQMGFAFDHEAEADDHAGVRAA